MKLSSGVSTETGYKIRDQQRMQRARNYFEWQARLACPQLGRRVLEIGCGMGNFTRHLLDAFGNRPSVHRFERDRFQNQ